MRTSEAKKKRCEFFAKLKKKLTEVMCRVIDVLAKPIEAFDRWQDRYERGYNDGIDAVCEGAVWVALNIYKDKHKVIEEKCRQIETAIRELELHDPGLHTEVESIEGSVQEILKQVR